MTVEDAPESFDPAIPDTIEQRSEEQASGDSQGNNQQDHGLDRTTPFARSNFLSTYVLFYRYLAEVR